MGEGKGEEEVVVDLFLRLDGTLQIRLDAHAEIFHLFPLEALEFLAHLSAEVLELQSHLVTAAFRVPDVRLQLLHLVLLRTTLAHELVERVATFGEVAFGVVVGLPAALALLKGLFDGPDQTNVLIDDDTKGEDVLLRLAVVQVADAELKV